MSEVTTYKTKRQTLGYHSWANMKRRCLSPDNPKYSSYGGRGITVCDRWLSFDNFIADMGEKPSPAHSIERIDNNGNYELSNCRWATVYEQGRNKRNNRKVIGVYHYEPRKSREKRWLARLQVNNKIVFSKYFETEQEAIIARLGAEKDYNL